MKNIPVVLLNGGRGYYSEEFKKRVPKGIVSTLNKPLIYHVISQYLDFNHNDFIISGGLLFDFSKNIILNSFDNNEKINENYFNASIDNHTFTIRFVDTGEDSLTWKRIKATEQYINSDYFALSYSDTFSKVNLSDAQNEFLKSNALISLTATKLPIRFRVLGLVPGNDYVQGFASKPVIQNDFINGGFYFIKSNIFQLYKDEDNVAFEEIILNQAVTEKDIFAYKYDGDWQHFDSDIDISRIEKMIKKDL